MNKEIKKIGFFILLIFGVFFNNLNAQSSTRTKIRLFAQTTGFDSIVAKNDSIIFYNIDSVHKVYIADLDSMNERIDSVTFSSGILNIYENDSVFAITIAGAYDTLISLSVFDGGTNDTLFLRSVDSTLSVVLEDLDSMNERIDSVIFAGGVLNIYENDSAFSVSIAGSYDTLRALTISDGGINDTLTLTSVDSTLSVVLEDLDSTNEKIDSISFNNDTLRVYEGGNEYLTRLIAGDADWYKIGTTTSPGYISDSIYTEGEVQLTDYPNTRGDDTAAHLNTLYTDASGTIQSARREIIPPDIAIDVSSISASNTFNYYNHYSTQMTNAGLTPIALADLDFYVLYFDNTFFANVSINMTTGVLSYDVIATGSSNSNIDVRFYTK